MTVPAVVIILRDEMPTAPWALVGYAVAAVCCLVALVFIVMAAIGE